MSKGQGIRRQPIPTLTVRGIGEAAPELSQPSQVPGRELTNSKLKAKSQVGLNMSFTTQIMALSEHSRGITDIALLRDAFKQYLELCEMYNIPPNNLAAYGAIGISTATAKMWAANKAGREKKEFIDWVNQFVGLNRETNIVTGAMSPQVGMFLQKNFDGLSDTPTQVVEETDLLGEKPSADDIIDRYSDLPEE